MSKAFQAASKHTKKKISYVLMDACSMNLVENAYELTLHKAAKIFLGSSGFVPLKGYDYKSIMERFCAQKNFLSFKKTMKEHRGNLGRMEAVLLDQFLLASLKQKLSTLAKRLIQLGISPVMLNNSDETLICLSELLRKILRFSNDPVLTAFSTEALKLLNQINLTGSRMKIFCPRRQETFNYFAGYYGSLSFSENNFWPLWLSREAMLANNSFSNLSSPTFLPLGILTEHHLNLNVGMAVNEAKEIYKRLGWA